MKISYLGPKGTFSHEACLNYCKDKYKLIESNTINDCIDLLKNNEVDYAIVPAENSLEGGVTETIDILISSPNIYVIDEVTIDINQNLMSTNCIPIERINKIYSHSQAISQCKRFLTQNNLLDKVVKVESTGKGALKALKDETSACIGNIACANLYKLKVIKKNIQENKTNKTRFWVLSKKEEYKEKIKKVVLFFSVEHKPGALFHALQIFSVLNINLSRIESRPTKERLGEYIFLTEVDYNDNLNMAIKLFKDNNLMFRIIGKY